MAMAMAALARRCASSLSLSLSLSRSIRPVAPFSIRSAVVAAAAPSPWFRIGVTSPDTARTMSSRPGYSPLNDSSPNWSNRPPKETILLDGCDYEHWLVVLEFPNDAKLSGDEMVAAYVKTLAAVVGSEEEAKKKIYSVSTTTYTGFGALISEELSYKVKEVPGVLWVLPDSYLDVPNKDYGGDLFVDGKVIRRPQFDYSEPKRQPTNRPRPRYDRHRETMRAERRVPVAQQMPREGN